MTQCRRIANTQWRYYSGFTLLEMMLTVGLIALTATFVGLNIGGSDARLTNLEAKRFVALLNLAQDESIISGRPILLTIDAAGHSYQFAPLDVPAVFLSASSEDDNLAEPDTPGIAYSAQQDSFFKQRFIPEPVTIQFSRLPDLPDADAGDGFVPKAVHELLNKSLFDDNEPIFEEDKAAEVVLIEPNGLISPFSLILSIQERVSSVGLDRFGRASLLDTR